MTSRKNMLTRQASRKLEDYLLAEWPKIKESNHTMPTLAAQVNAQNIPGLPHITPHNIKGALEALDLIYEMPRSRGPQQEKHEGNGCDCRPAIEAMQELCGSLEQRLSSLEAGHNTNVREVQNANSVLAQHNHRIQQMHGLTEGERANIETRLRSLENIAARFQKIEDLLKDNKSKLGRLATRAW